MDSCSVVRVGATLLLICLSSAALAASSFDKGPDGVRVLYHLMEDLGYHTTRVFETGPALEQNDVLVLVGEVEPQAGKQLWRWVKQGHLLLFAPSLVSARGFCGSSSLGPRLRLQRELAVNEKQGQLHDTLDLRPSACLLQADDSGTTLAGNSQGALAVEHAVGKGAILVLAHSDLVANFNLHRDDLAVLVRRWLTEAAAPPQRLAFWETHQGGNLLRTLDRAHMTPLLLHGVLWLLALYWCLAPRFGDSCPAPASTRRAFSEHARALGHLYQRQGASPHVLRQLYQRFLSRLRSGTDRAGRARGEISALQESPDKEEKRALAATVATRTGRDPAEVELLLTRVERAIHSVGGQEGKVAWRNFRLGQALAELQRRERPGKAAPRRQRRVQPWEGRKPADRKAKGDGR